MMARFIAISSRHWQHCHNLSLVLTFDPIMKLHGTYLLNFREKRHNQQEDDLFSTYESLKAHASPSPPPALLWTDLSKDEKKTLGKAKSPCSTAATKTFVVKAEKAGVKVRILNT